MGLAEWAFGPVLAALFAPILAKWFGGTRHGLAVIPLAMVFVVSRIIARTAGPAAPKSPRPMPRALKVEDAVVHAVLQRHLRASSAVELAFISVRRQLALNPVTAGY